MKYESEKRLATGTKVVFIKAIFTNNTEIGDKGIVELNRIHDYTYGVRKENGFLLGVYSSEIDIITEKASLVEELLRDRLSCL